MLSDVAHLNCKYSNHQFCEACKQYRTVFRTMLPEFAAICFSKATMLSRWKQLLLAANLPSQAFHSTLEISYTAQPYWIFQEYCERLETADWPPTKVAKGFSQQIVAINCDSNGAILRRILCVLQSVVTTN